ncbi:unnamed protein product [Heterosigma akashiwo]
MKRKADEISESEMKDLLRKYLLPMSQEQMMELLINIGSENAAAFEEIENTAEQDPEARKVFVRDLPRGCSKEDLEAALAEAFGLAGSCPWTRRRATTKCMPSQRLKRFLRPLRVPKVES